MNQQFNNVDYCEADKVPIAGDHDFVLPLLDKQVELLHYILILGVGDDDQTFLANNTSYFIDNILVRAMLTFLNVNRISNTLLILQIGLLVLWSLIIITLLIVFEHCVIMFHGDTQGYQSINENLGSCSLKTVYTSDNALSNLDIKILHCRKERVVIDMIFHCEIFHRRKNIEHYIRVYIQPVVIPCKQTSQAQILLEFLLLCNHLLNTMNIGKRFVRAIRNVNASHTTTTLIVRVRRILL